MRYVVASKDVNNKIYIINSQRNVFVDFVISITMCNNIIILFDPREMIKGIFKTVNDNCSYRETYDEVNFYLQ